MKNTKVTNHMDQLTPEVVLRDGQHVLDTFKVHKTTTVNEIHAWIENFGFRRSAGGASSGGGGILGAASAAVRALGAKEL